MSDERELHDNSPSQDWIGGAHGDIGMGPVREWLKSQLSHSGSSPIRESVFQAIRDTLEEAGIPFIRANELAERCHKALGSIL